MIVDHHGQIISKQSVAAVDNKIFARQLWVSTDVAAQGIMETHHRMLLFNSDGGILRPVV